MSIFLILHAPQLPKEKNSLYDLSSVWCVDMFFKIGSASLALVAARVAKDRTFKNQYSESIAKVG